MATLEEYKTALRMRDILRKLAADVIEEKVGKTEYVTVVSVDYFNRRCTVRYASGNTTVVSMGSKWPSAVGQIVRLGGTRGDRYIDDVMGPVALPANSYFKSVDDVDLGARSQWDGSGVWGNWIAKVVQDTLTFAYGASEATVFSVNQKGLWTPANSGMSTISTDYGIDQGTTTSTAYTKTLTGSASLMDSTFIAPPSGRVIVALQCRIAASAGSAYFAAQVRVNPSGTIVLAYSDDAAVFSSATAQTTGSVFIPVGGLTPGTTYRLEGSFRSSIATSTATFDSMRTVVWPSLGA
jgi:hypothetical protein